MTTNTETINFFDETLSDERKLALWDDLVKEMCDVQEEVEDLKERLCETENTADTLYSLHGSKCMWLQKKFNADCHIPGVHNDDQLCLCSRCAPGVTERRSDKYRPKNIFLTQ